jgi:KUP system potassium uptake protein
MWRPFWGDLMAQADAGAPSPSDDASKEHDPNGTGGSGHMHAGFWTLLIGSIGVVYGDIGTSPLYAFRDLLLARGRDRL